MNNFDKTLAVLTEAERDWMSIAQLKGDIYDRGEGDEWVFAMEAKYIPKEILDTIPEEYRSTITGAIFNDTTGEVWLTDKPDPYVAIYMKPSTWISDEE